MHKGFYASGFLYHSPSQQILLHQPSQEATNGSALWQMFGAIIQKEKSIEEVFPKVIYSFLKLKIDSTDIYPIYSYFHPALNKIHYVYYAEIASMPKLHVPKKSTVSWFTFKQTLKLSFTDQTKQDLIVAQRVINARDRNIALSILTP